MSLPPFIYRDIGEEVEASDQVIYRAFIRHLGDDPRPPIAVIIIRAARDCGVSRQRAWEVVRKYNPGLDSVLRGV